MNEINFNVNINPMTRLEGHLDINTIVENKEVKDVEVSGALFRGFELILKDRDPTDAPVFSQRICGVCPASHAMASALCLDDALGISRDIPANARIIRNLILGANFIQSDILNFYHLSILDYMDITAVEDYTGCSCTLKSVKKFLRRGAPGPFLPRYKTDFRLHKKENIAAVKNYIKAFDIRRNAHEMLALFGGKMPHQCGIVPGGAAVQPVKKKINRFKRKLKGIIDFIDNIYHHDMITIAGRYKDYFSMGTGCEHLLSYGAFDLEDGGHQQEKRKRFMRQGLVTIDNNSLKFEKLDISKITEDIKHSWYDGDDKLPPAKGRTEPNREKAGGYTFIKAPRYNGKVVETGPLARVLVNYALKDKSTVQIVKNTLSKLGMKHGIHAFSSIMGRHLARFIECKLIAHEMKRWLSQLQPKEPFYSHYGEVREEGHGFGITGAPRGALGHWLEIQNKKIKNYQVVTPTTWNASPRDAEGKRGPMELALMGLTVNDGNNPIEIARLVRAFDPCTACAAHVLDPSGAVTGEFRVL